MTIQQTESLTRESVEEVVRRVAQEVVERVAWEVIPSLAEIAVQKGIKSVGGPQAPLDSPASGAAAQTAATDPDDQKAAEEASRKIAQEVVERVAWEVIPSLAEITIKKEIERLTTEA